MTITVKHKTKGITRTVMSDIEGEYTLRNLLVGQYTVTISKDGFNTIEQENITVSLGQSVIFEPTLGAGSDIERKIEQDRWLASIDYYINEDHSINVTAFNNEKDDIRNFIQNPRYDVVTAQQSPRYASFKIRYEF